VTDPEREALWELAASGERVRLLFIERALQRPLTSRQLRDRADMAVHAATGLDLGVASQEWATSLGAAGYLHKPVTEHELVGAVGATLARLPAEALGRLRV
jgi:hypothetical protein